MPDYSVGNAPAGASYAAPLVGFQFGQELAALPDQYMKGREASRKIQMEDMFKGGIPQNPDGSPDVNAIMDKGAKIGGLPFVQQMLPFLQQMTFANKIGEGMGQVDQSLYGGGSAAPPGRPANIPNAAGPSNLQGQPRLSSAGMDNQGADTARSLAAERGVDPDALAKAFPGFGAIMDRPLSPQGAQEVAKRIANFKAGQPAAQARPSEDVTPRPEDSSANERAMNGPSAAPTVAGGVSGSPGPSQEPAGRTFQERFDATRPTGLPPGVSPEAAQRYERAGAHVDNLAAQAAAAKNPELSAALKQRAQALYDIAKQQREQLGEAAKLTPEQKQARDAAVIAAKETEARGKQKAELYSKDYEGYRKLGQESQVGLQKANLAKSMVNDPNFYSGPLEPTTRLYKQFASYFGSNPSSAVPQEAFHKVVNDMLTEQIRALGGSGVGQVRVAEVNIMKNAIANLGITPMTNRMLIEIVSRTYKDNTEIAKMAREYKGGNLDAGFDAKVADYYKSHPLFKDKELQDPRLIAPPEFKSFADARKANLGKGTPVKINGELYHVNP